MIRSLARKILEKAGFQVLVAESGQEGVRLFSENKDDVGLVLLDMRMEGLSGIETLRLIRQLSPEVPCIISTGQVTELDDLPEDIQTSVRFLHKPYRAASLTEAATEMTALKPR